jgi:hypothetical protein
LLGRDASRFRLRGECCRLLLGKIDGQGHAVPLSFHTRTARKAAEIGVKHCRLIVSTSTEIGYGYLNHTDLSELGHIFGVQRRGREKSEACPFCSDDPGVTKAVCRTASFVLNDCRRWAEGTNWLGDCRGRK